ncbi:hypothetical protein IWQ60_009546 [Tieghemiomyces parasiticus]|uniref:Uncharacterized protein n=1 Tax=Tieghemiomyces parasiticus TaxID=78921 RepID=A0A9W7ZMP7_9FUNG|nr:hypothetical protein IWQ60_009546 [Tieghemiomyces parasiticus]
MALATPGKSSVLEQIPAYLRDTPYAAYVLRLPEAKRAAALPPGEWTKKEGTEPIALSNGNLQANYTGQGLRDADAASIRSNRPIPSQCGIYYFEVTITDKGHDGFIGIGLSHSTTAATRLPGWDNNSWGYHGDDGNCFSGSGSGRPYGPTFTTDDVIGCCLNLWNHRVFFTKNGVRLYIAFHGVKGVLYPTVGMRTREEKVLANFGAQPFLFDIEQYYLDEKRQLWAAINAGPAPPVSAGPPDCGLIAALRHTARPGDPDTLTADRPTERDLTNDLILSYFIHHGYRHTARAFAQNVLGTTPQRPGGPSAALQRILSDLDDQDNEITVRQQISQRLLAGDVDRALRLTQRHYPRVLPQNEAVHFQLRCQQFVELIKQAGGAQAVDMLDEEGETGWDSASDGETDPPRTNGKAAMDVDGDREDVEGQDSPRTAAQLLRRALRCGHRLQADYAQDPRPEVRETLVNIFSLLAYADPRTSPMAHLLDEDRRRDLVHVLNEEILVSQHKPRVPPLELTVAQSKAVLNELINQGNPAANLIQLDRDLL